MTVADFVRLTRVNAALIFVMLSLGLLVAFGYTLRQPVVYTATSQGYVVVSNSGSSVGDVTSADALAQQKVSQYVGLVTSTRVAQDVISKLKLNASAGDIAGRFSAAGSSDQPVLTIFANAASPEEARNLANAVIGAISTEASNLESAARPAGAPANSLIKLIPTEQAGVPSRPSSPNYPRTLAVGAVVGILLGYLLALVRRQLDRRIRTVDDIESLIGTSVLSIVPESDELDRASSVGLITSTSGAAAEALRQLRTNLRFVDVDRPPHSIVITSANAGEGKSVVTANLARVLAAAGQPTVLIDGDLRRPMVANLFDIDPVVGLTQVLAGDVALSEVVRESGVPHLKVIVAGRTPPNPSELLGSQRMQSVIRELVDQGNQVLIDAPPILPVTDAGLISGIVDGSMLVLAVGRTYKEQSRLAAKILDQVGGHLLGAVLNRAPQKGIGAVVYGYGYAESTHDYYGSYVEGAGRRGLLGALVKRRRKPRAPRPEEPRGDEQPQIAEQPRERRRRRTSEPTPDVAANEPGPAPVTTGPATAPQDDGARTMVWETRPSARTSPWHDPAAQDQTPAPTPTNGPSNGAPRRDRPGLGDGSRPRSD